MGNTTFSGPVRSEGGFQSVTKNATTGAVTVNAVSGTGASLINEGSGITAGTGTIYASSVTKTGTLVHTQIYIDITGLDDGGTAAFIIGDALAANCHLGQITTAISGTLNAGSLQCLELPAGGDNDINVFSAVEATGVEGTAITDLDETSLGDLGDSTAGSNLSFTAFPADGEYLYLTLGTSTVNTYTGGKFIIHLYGVAV